MAPSALPGASRQTWLLPPPVGLPGPHPGILLYDARGCAPLRSPKWGYTPTPPWVGLPGPHPGFLSFHDERNQRRAGAAPLDPASAKRPPSLVLRCRLHPGYFLPQTQTDLPLWVGGQIGLCFSPSFTGGHTLSCQSVARQCWLRGCLRV